MEKNGVQIQYLDKQGGLVALRQHGFPDNLIDPVVFSQILIKRFEENWQSLKDTFPNLWSVQISRISNEIQPKILQFVSDPVVLLEDKLNNNEAIAVKKK